MSRSGEESVLDQNDIDSLVSVIAERNEPPAAGASAVAATVSPPAAPAPAPQTPGAGAQQSIGADVAQRIERLEAALSKLMQSGAAGGQPQAQLQALAKQVETLTAQVQALRQHVAQSVGYRVQETFECASCGEKGLVAGLVKCTACGGETWLGWWPQA